ncbi:restriction endonuclease [Streptomyces sp. NPDC057494]|uniref:nSTAND3 domain-containing NTPase n=1 Tax=Streptomyces sp. NPDC057494 TaxID=3346148 RepID=UPI0036B7653F
MARDYSDLSPHDFEILVRDLLQAEFGVRMETFPPGRDGGVDVRLHRDGKEALVVQCKHSPGRTFAQIRGQLDSEARKIGNRFDCRYMLVTSASLTRLNKEEIAVMFKGVGLDVGDILAVDDLDNLLRRHPLVEVNNFKLWITSSAVLEFLLRSELHRRSESLVDRIVKRRKLYVHSEAYPASLRMLHDHHVCIISGEPGIGKTTLAETLLVKLLADGWEVHSASMDIDDIEKVWKPNVKQAFLYDDFLGQNSLLDSLNKNEDSRLANVVERVRDSGDKMLIMTTREYILQQAQQVYERLQNSGSLRDGKMILNLSHYTRDQKAQVFYNHVHFADLPEVARRSILRAKRYLEVIQHANFNPRIIEFVTANFKDSGVPDDRFCEYVIEALENPRNLWERIFQNQLSGTERRLLLVLATLRTVVESRDLLRALNTYEAADGGPQTDAHKFRLVLKKLQGTFIRVASNVRLDDQANGLHPDSTSTLVYLANPSFVDFISAHLSSQPDEVIQMVRGCAFFEQAETLALWEIGEIPENAILREVLDVFFEAPRNHRRPRRLAPGQQNFLMGALVRLMLEPACTWVESPRDFAVMVRHEFSHRQRHLIMLMLDAKHGRNLIPGQILSKILEGASERIRSATSGTVQIEFRLMRYLSRYQGMAASVMAARDAVAEKMMERLETPDDFNFALGVFTDLDVEPTVCSQRSEFELRRRFAEFLPTWDFAEAGRVNHVWECEESLSVLQEVLERFEADGSFEPDALNERLLMLQDEVNQELDFDGEDPESSETESDLGPRRRMLEFADPPGDPIDDLFETLI